MGDALMLCGESWIWVHLTFWPMMALLTYLVSRHNRLGIWDTILAAIGLKRFARTTTINVVQVLTLLVPLGLAARAIQSCPT